MKITAVRNDDRSFVREVQTLLNGILPHYRPGELFFARIDDWFDKNRLGLNTSPLGKALSPLKMPRLNVPWFSRGRIIDSRYFVHQNDGELKEQKRADLLKLLAQERDRRISDISKNAMFIWISGNSARNGRGSLLIYFTRDGVDTGWFAGFDREEAWHVEQIH